MHGHLAFIQELRKVITKLAEGGGENRKEWSYLKKAKRINAADTELQGPKGMAHFWEKLVNARNNKGQTPLMLACLKGYTTPFPFPFPPSHK